MKQFFILAVALLSASLLRAEEWSSKVEAECGEKVIITAIPETGYHFVKWEDDETQPAEREVEVSDNKVYKAVFAINEYTITFYGADGEVLQTGTYKHGETVTVPSEVTKEADAQYTYTFLEWSPNVNNTAEADAEYTPVFESTLRKYYITFANWNGEVLEKKEWNYGDLPSYDGEKPTRPTDEGTTYTFTGWDPTIMKVEGEQTYTAQFNGQTRSYELTVSGENGVTTGSGTYQYGAKVEVTATANSCYHFVEWSDGDKNANRTVEITGTTNLVATFEIDKFTIEVVSDDETQGKVGVRKK